MSIALFLIIGLCVGLFSGLFGVGGGILLVPALTIVMGFSQAEAQGTTLAMMVPPIGLFAAAQYYRHGFVRIDAAILLAISFAVGAWLIAGQISRFPQVTLQRLFGLLLCFVAGQHLLSGTETRWGWVVAAVPTFLLGVLLRRNPRARKNQEDPPPIDYSI